MVDGSESMEYFLRTLDEVDLSTLGELFKGGRHSRIVEVECRGGKFYADTVLVSGYSAFSRGSNMRITLYDDDSGSVTRGESSGRGEEWDVSDKGLFDMLTSDIRDKLE